MRKVVVLAGIFLLFPLAAHAQKNEIFLGYSFMRMEAAPSNVTISGWEGSYTRLFSPYFGLTGDTSGHYGTISNARLNFHSYLMGPQVELPLPRNFSPFVHALIGVSRESFQNIVSHKLSFCVGGGIDYRISDDFSFRLIQIDYITANFTQTAPESRFSTGVQLRF